MNLKILLLVFIIVSVEAMAQRSRPSSGRSSGRTGSSSSSSGSSSSTVSSGARSSGSTWSRSSGSSSSSSSRSSSSSSSSGSSYSGGSSYSRNYGSGRNYGSTYYDTYAQRARKRSQGKNPAPILKDRLNGEWGKTIQYGTVQGNRRYVRKAVRRRVIVHRPYSTFGSCSGFYYGSPRSYHLTVSSSYYYNRWMMEPTYFYYGTGFNCMGGYPYYVHDGYRYRYSDKDICDYDLIDTEKGNSIQSFYSLSCNVAYDKCAKKRDQLNGSYQYNRYVCVEKMDNDLWDSAKKRIPSLTTELTAKEKAELESFVSSNTPQKLFKLGKKGLNKCKIKKINRTKNEFGCNYFVQVDGKTYPFNDGTVCSHTKNSGAAALGCESGSQMKNAACILSLAILEGYCKE